MTSENNPEPALFADRYRLHDPLGRGGMSVVYRATDEALGRQVAIKVLSALDGDTNAIDRAQSEIRVLASLSHRGLVTLFDAGTAQLDGADRMFLAMELIDGPSLADRLREGPLSDAEASLLVTEIAEALHTVHSRGIIHRDIKPANILLAQSDMTGRSFDAKLADFGIATLTDRTSDLTAAGTIVGTAAYLSPEQPRGETATGASDVYALGIVLIEALTGEHPFPGTLAETLAARLSRSPTIPATLSYQWRSLLGAMTALEPADRPTPLQLIERLNGDGEPGATIGMPTDSVMAAAIAAEATPGTQQTIPLDVPAPEGYAATLLMPGGQTATPTEPSDGTRRTRRIIGAVIAVAVAGVIVSVIALAGLGNPTDPSTKAPASTPTIAAEPTPATSTPPSPTSTASTTTQTGTTGNPGNSNGNGTQGNGNGNGKGKSNGNGNGKGNGNGNKHKP